MITESYSPEPGMISPKSIYGKGKKISDVCIVTFSNKLMKEIIKDYTLEKEEEIKSTNGSTMIYSLLYKGKRICLYNSFMGSALAGTCMIEASHFVGARKFIMFGSCGRLDSSIPNRSFIVPTEAYRDEGFSYHYAKASDYIPIKNHAFIESFLAKLNIPFVVGKVWTTDAFYKETKSEVSKRRAEGCVAVEMECAGCQAVSDFYNWDFYEFFFGGDLLDAEAWDKASMGSVADKKRHNDIFELALEMALIV